MSIRREPAAHPRSKSAGALSLGVAALIVLFGTAATWVARMGVDHRSTEAGYQLRVDSGVGSASDAHNAVQEAVTVAAQLDATGQPTLLITTPGSWDGRPVTEVRVSTQGLESAVAGHLPEGWSAEAAGGDLTFTGPALADASAHFRIDLGAAATTQAVNVLLSAGGSAVYDRATDVAQLAQMQVIEVLADVLHFPWQVTPGEVVTFQAVANSPIVPGGRWSIAGSAPQVLQGAAGQPLSYQWQVPTTLTPSSAVTVTWTNPFGQVAVNVPTANVGVVTPPAAAAQAPPRLIDCTPRGFAGRVVCLCGWFPTAAERDGFTLDGQPLGVVAASSTTVLVRIPGDAQPGPRTIAADPGRGFDASQTISIVVLAARGSVDQNRLRRGQSTPLRLEVLGTTEQLDIVLTNYTPGIVQVTGGIVQVVRTSGGTPNVAQRQVQGITPGNFDIGYQLAEDPCPCVDPPGTVVAGTPTPSGDTPPPGTGLPPVPPAGPPPPGGGTTTGPPPGDSTTTGPPMPPIPGPPPVPPANPPAFPPPTDETDHGSCCGFRPDGTITFPKITDPLIPAAVAVAPRSPAVGGSQVLLHNGAYFHSDTDLSVDALGLPFVFTRHYKGDVQTVDGGLLGHRWDFSLNKRIVPQAARELGNNLLLERPVVETPQLWYFDGQGRGVLYDGVNSEWRDVLNFGKRQPFRAFVTTYRQQPGDFYEIQRYVLENPADHPFASHPNVQVEQGEGIFYVLRERNGVRYVFNCRGQLLMILHRNDRMSLAGAGVDQPSDSVRMTFEYDGALNPLTQNRTLSRITDPSGHVFTLTTRNIGSASLQTNIDCVPRSEIIPIPRLAELRGGGLVVTFDYGTGSDGNPVLRTVTRGPRFATDSLGSGGRTTRYAYDHGDRLESVTSPKQVASSGIPYVTNRYDGMGRVQRQVLGDTSATVRQESTFAYGNAAATVSDAVGNSIAYALATVSGHPVVRSQTVIQRDSANNARWTTAFEHNAHTQITKITEPRGNEVLFQFDGRDDPVTLGWIRNKSAAVTYASDLSAGNLIAVTRSPGSAGPGPSVTTTTSYEPLFNQTETQDDGRGYRTEYTFGYDRVGDLGNILTRTIPEITRPDGSTVQPRPNEYAYNPRGQRIRASAGGRRTTTWQYNREGYLFEERLPTAATRRYSRDAFGRVLGEFSELGDVRYDRNEFGEVTRETLDPSGLANATDYTYDADGMLVETRRELKDNFNPGSGLPPVERSRWVVERRDYDVLGRMVREVKSGGGDSLVFVHRYDANGLLMSSTRPGPDGRPVTETFQYDARGLPTFSVDASGTTSQRVVRTDYDANGNETRIEQSGGRVATGAQPGPARVTLIEYDGLDRVLAEVDPLGSRTQYDRDVDGNVVRESVTDASGRLLARTEYEVDEVSQIVRTRRHILDGSGGTVEERVFYNDLLDVERSVGAAGGTVEYAYDAAGRPLEVVTASGDTTRMRYDRAGNKTEVFLVEVGETMDPGGNRVPSRLTTRLQYEHDALGRVTREQGANSDARYAYDSFGHLRGTRLADGTADSIRYDGMGRKVSHRAGRSTKTFRYGPSGLPVEIDTDGQRLVVRRDAHGNVIEESKTGAGVMRIDRDGLGNPVRVTDANGTVTLSTFNGVGQPVIQQITVQSAGGGGTPSVIAPSAIHWEYDGLGRVTTAEARHGPMGGDRIVSRLRYDGLSRVTSEDQEMDGETYTLQRTHSPTLLSTTATYPSQAGGLAVERVADALGRLQYVSADGSPIATYTYSGPDRVSARRYRNGAVTRYTLDGEKRLQRVEVSATSGFTTPKRLWSSAVAYGRFGIDRVEQTWHPTATGDWSETLTEMTYTPLGVSTGSATTVTQYTDTTTVASRMRTALHHDMVGGVHVGSGEIRYDLLNQNTAFVRADEFQVDSVGRKAQLDVTIGTQVGNPGTLLTDPASIAASANGATDRLNASKRFTYDNRGLLISDGELNYSYDHQGRLTWVEEVTTAGGLRGEAVRFTHDAFGRRVRSFPIQPNQGTGLVAWSPGWSREPAHFLYDGDDVIAELASPGSGVPAPRLRRRYVIGARPGERVRVEDFGTAGGEVFYPHEGVQSDVGFVTNAAGAVQRLTFVTPQPGTGFSIPDDARQIEGTQARAPYLSWTQRVDGFAGVKTDELTGAPQLDYRVVRALADSAGMLRMRQAVSTASNNGALVLGASSSAVVAGMVGGAALAGGFANMTWSGVGYMVGVSSAVEVGMGAASTWAFGGSYGFDSFLRDAGTGAVFGVLGGRMVASGWSATRAYLGEQLMESVYQTATGVAQGRGIGEAWADALAEAAVGGVAGVGIIRVTRRNAGQGVRLGRRATSGRALSGRARGGAPAGGGARAPSGRATGQSIVWGEFADKVEQTGFRSYGMGLGPLEELMEETLEALERGTRLSRITARAIRKGRLKVRLANFNKDNLFGFVHPDDPTVMYINTELLIGRHARGPNRVAATIVHEAVHSFGGGEIASHIAQAQFMKHTLARVGPMMRGSRTGARLWMDSEDIRLLEAWEKGRSWFQFNHLTQVIKDWGYHKDTAGWLVHFPSQRIDHRIKRRGGFAVLLDVDPDWAARAARLMDPAGVTGHWE